MNWKTLFKKQARPISFGILFTLSSGFGQTFFISLFVEPLSRSFGLTVTEFASLYAALTLTSAALLPFFGRMLDRMDILIYSFGVCLMVATGVLLLTVGDSVLFLFVGMLLIRMSGQGLMSHLGVTSVARSVIVGRGKALALTTLGHPIGEAIFPFLAIFGIEHLGWRATYAMAAGFVLFLAYPLAFLLVRAQPSFRMVQAEESEENTSDQALAGEKKSKLRLPLGLIFILIPSYVAAPMLLTAFIFHQGLVAKYLGFEIELFAQGFVLFAVFQVICIFGAGIAVDRFSAKRVYQFHLLPLMVALIVMSQTSSVYSVLVYLALMGATGGFGNTSRASFVADLVPPRLLGSTKSLGASLMVFSTALGPAAFGWMLEFGVTWDQLFLGALAYCVFATGLAMASSWQKSSAMK